MSGWASQSLPLIYGAEKGPRNKVISNKHKEEEAFERGTSLSFPGGGGEKYCGIKRWENGVLLSIFPRLRGGEGGEYLQQGERAKKKEMETAAIITFSPAQM